MVFVWYVGDWHVWVSAPEGQRPYFALHVWRINTHAFSSVEYLKVAALTETGYTLHHEALKEQLPWVRYCDTYSLQDAKVNLIQ